MTDEEFEVALLKLIKEFVESDENNNIFVITYNDKIGIAYSYGFGCQGCAYDHIQSLKIKGHFSHDIKGGVTH